MEMGSSKSVDTFCFYFARMYLSVWGWGWACCGSSRRWKAWWGWRWRTGWWGARSGSSHTQAPRTAPAGWDLKRRQRDHSWKDFTLKHVTRNDRPYFWKGRSVSRFCHMFFCQKFFSFLHYFSYFESVVCFLVETRKMSHAQCISHYNFNEFYLITNVEEMKLWVGIKKFPIGDIRTRSQNLLKRVNCLSFD